MRPINPVHVVACT
ncbi:hypothetical protein F383_30296 [Gossypium arboreum]|nr:hypothetical protein F383_30296 [Gossypium arboreum]